jgi:hypothetical protein
VTTRTMTWAGVVCLVVGPTALLGQALLTPWAPAGIQQNKWRMRRAISRRCAGRFCSMPRSCCSFQQFSS